MKNKEDKHSNVQNSIKQLGLWNNNFINKY